MLVGNAGRHAWLQVVREYGGGLLRTPTNVSSRAWKPGVDSSILSLGTTFLNTICSYDVTALSIHHRW